MASFKIQKNIAKVMYVGHSIQTQYHMINNDKAYTVTETDEEKDLGVYITKDLKWSCHVTGRSELCTPLVHLSFPNNFAQPPDSRN